MQQGDRKFLVIGVVVFIVFSGALFYAFFLTQDKTAFFYNQKVFNQFEGTKELTDKLNEVKAQNKSFLDSLKLYIEQGRKDLIPVYQERSEILSLNEKNLSDKYTKDIWLFINDGVAEYGSKNKYDYLFGAVGNGSLMFADSSHDVTIEVVRFLNNKYSGNEK